MYHYRLRLSKDCCCCCCRLTMSFYHVLPSNSSKEAFPDNNASEYRTTVPTPYRLDGDWEVAVMSMTHSNCIYTFANDAIEIEEESDTTSSLPTTSPSVNKIDWNKIVRPTQLAISWSLKTVSTMTAAAADVDKERLSESLVSDINSTLDGILKFTIWPSKLQLKNGFVAYNFLNTNVAVILNRQVADFLQTHDVLTHGDVLMNGGGRSSGPIPSLNSPSYITVLPLKQPVIKLVLKSIYETIDIATLVQRFNDNLWLRNTLGYRMLIEKEKGKEDVIVLEKTSTVNGKPPTSALLLQTDLQKALSLRHRGLHDMTQKVQLVPKFANSYDKLWSVNVYLLHRANHTNSRPIHLPASIHASAAEACAYFTKYINNPNVLVTYSPKSQRAQLHLKQNGIKLRLSKDVRDIFGFDSLVYEGKGIYPAKGALSLTRCINYFYIYSNIADYVRIGDTEAPLLAVTAFNPKACHELREIVFKRPFYIPVKQQVISQIDIAIYDGAGQLVPFDRNAVTSLQLHFRQRRRAIT